MDSGLVLELLRFFYKHTWGRARMILPFSSGKKAFWNLRENMDRINFAIQETEPQHFEEEVLSLYPRIEKYGMVVPLIHPIRTRDRSYNNTWHRFHLTCLKALRRQIRNRTFDLGKWNSDMMRENGKREAVTKKK